MVAARSQPAVRSGRAGEAGVGELLSRRARPRPTSRTGSTALAGRRAGAPPPDSSRTIRRRRRPAQLRRRARTASSTRASWRAPRRCCAKPRRSPAQPTLKTLPDHARRRVPHATTTTRATSRGWSSTPSIEPTIGPYEVYEDEWFNYKAAFEAFITVRDDAESKKLQAFCAAAAGAREQPADRSEVPQPEARRARAHPRRQRRLHRRRRQPRRADRRLQPAERRARGPGEGHQARDAEEHAGREVQAGAAADLARSRCSAADQTNVSFDAFFTHILMHELMHGLGPHNITRRRPRRRRCGRS